MSTQETLDVVDNTLETIEDTLELIDRKNTALILSGGVLIGGVVGLVVGSYIGYRTSMKVLEPKYAALAEDEIKEAKAFYYKLYKGDDLSTPEKAVETLITSPKLENAAKALVSYQGGGDHDSNSDGESKVEVTTENVFTQSHSDYVWDQEVELERRVLTEPYVIHEDEWSEGVEGYNKVTLTWYDGDSVLVDEKDEPIVTVDDAVGEENLKRFGHGTQDSRTVFVRNERLMIDFEILKHDGKYAYEVLGFQHSERIAAKDGKLKVQRFRDGDE